MVVHVMIIAPEDLPIPPIRGGSVQIYVNHLYEALSQRDNFRVTLVSPGSTANRIRHPQGRHIHIIVQRSTPTEYWRRVRHMIRKRHPDIVQIENRPSRALEVIRRFPEQRVILNLHSTTFLGARHITRQRARNVLTHAHGIVCNSRDLSETIREQMGLSEHWHPSVIYPGLTLPPTIRAAHTDKRPHHPLRVLYVGRVIAQKGVHVAVDAVKLLASDMAVSFTIVGRTPPWEKAYRKALLKASADADIRFLGFVPPTELNDVYAEHDILICPSQKHEAFGLVNIEAMSHGLPVVASQLGGIPEAIGDEAGILVRQFHRSSAFAQAIRKIVVDGDTYRQYSQAASARASQFTWAASAKHFAAVYEQIAKRS